jgi:hypothetical protein|tara:strand:- start:970 stop:1227 length:258 start_codon:yes stop_codon:yes gene_type:complete
MSGLFGHNSGDKKFIINISDLYDEKDRKEKELQFYTKELDKLMLRLGMLQHEIGVTETIINMIEGEYLVDLKEAIKARKIIKGIK